MTMTEGEMPNLLEGVTSDQDSILDYSIDNEYSFKTKGGLTSVDLVCSGKNDKQSLKKLRPGKYNLYYTARSSTDSTKPATRRTVILTVLPNGKQDLIELDRENLLKTVLLKMEIILRQVIKLVVVHHGMLQMPNLQNIQDVLMKEIGVVFYQKIVEMRIFTNMLI